MPLFVDLGKQVSSVEKVLQRQWDLLYTKMRKLTISRNYDMLEKLLKEHYVNPTNNQQSPRTQSTTENKTRCCTLRRAKNTPTRSFVSRMANRK